MPEDAKEQEILVDKVADSSRQVENQRLDRVVVDLHKIADNSQSASDVLDDILKMQESDIIPWEQVTLPSRGHYYNGAIPDGVVRVKAMGAYAEKILATQRLAQTGQAIDYLFEHCVQLPNGFPHSSLLVGDRTFLIYVMRGITYGNEYEFIATCPHCDTKGTYRYDLNELAATIKGPSYEQGPEPFRVDLPQLSESLGCKAYVKVRLARGQDASEISKTRKFKKRVSAATGAPRREIIDESITEHLALLVVAFGVDGKTGEDSSREKIKALMDRLHSNDNSAIREFLKDHTPGVDSSIQIECAECAAKSIVELPITEGFFRPPKRGGAGERI